MSNKKIDKLTPEQEALISAYREKWRIIALSTERIDKEKAAKAVKEAYGLIGLDEPKIVFCDSPYSAFRNTFSQLDNPVHKQLRQHLNSQFFTELLSQVKMELLNTLIIELENGFSKKIWNQIYLQLCVQLEEELSSLVKNRRFNNIQYIEPELWACEASWVDFCASVLNCTYPQKKWLVFQQLIKNCHWIFPFKGTVFLCNRPTKLSFDKEQRLHALWEPAIEFADGYSLYSNHGVTLPKKYDMT
ncbi:hypothetical protein A6770_31390 [Nostoc minutum NIES-26]|uniref:DUF6745 domain-containing protein n=1 Tax=Nostoc minutum NIES-26 TaxID=1844469 RepID=A0A367Q9R7_9NOSO|nr:hypothetical protein A6770_31390 [Nostoc minutum NIES-26]